MSKIGNYNLGEIEKRDEIIIELWEALEDIEFLWKDSDSEAPLAFEMAEIARKTLERTKP